MFPSERGRWARINEEVNKEKTKEKTKLPITQKCCCPAEDLLSTVPTGHDNYKDIVTNLFVFIYYFIYSRSEL